MNTCSNEIPKTNISCGKPISAPEQKKASEPTIMPPSSRKRKREHLDIEVYLVGLYKIFANYKPSPALNPQEREQAIADKFEVLNRDWKHFCHKKFRFYEPPLDAFEKYVEKLTK